MDELEKTKQITDLNIKETDIEKLDLETLREIKETFGYNSNEFATSNTVGNDNNEVGKRHRYSNNAYGVDHSSYPGMRSSGFATNLIFGLIIAFASGAIVSTIYIFMNLGNSVFTL